MVITIGQYQLLVDEAVPGLQTMFTLEAMGLLYANLMQHSVDPAQHPAGMPRGADLVRGECACRVMVLALVTY